MSLCRIANLGEKEKQPQQIFTGLEPFPNPGNTAENTGVLYPITNPQFLHETFAFGELFDAEFPNWESPPAEPMNIL